MARRILPPLLAGLMAACAGPVFAALHWIEGESAPFQRVYPNAGLDEADPDELSGGAWISSFSENGNPAGVVGYAVRLASSGQYALWVRANDRATGLAFRLDSTHWTPVDAEAMAAQDKAARDQWQRVVRDVERKRKGAPAVAPPEPAARVVDHRPVSLDGSTGFRALAWIHLGTHSLPAGEHKVEFLLGSDGASKAEKMWNAVDCLVLADEPFQPHAKFRPGENWPEVIRFQPGQAWEFQPEPDPLSPDALLDLRFLNEKVAGEHGFIRRSADGMDFVRGDGQPIRFWGGSDYNQRNLSFGELVRHAQFLAKRGVNIVRWHGHLPPTAPRRAPEGQAAPAPSLSDINAKELDEAFKLVAAMKQAGIYTILSPYWGSHTEVLPPWGIPDNANLSALVFFYPKVQEAYKGWIRTLYTTPNPYNGIPLKDDPAVAIIQIQNEDSMLFYTMQRVAGEPLMVLRRQYARWVARKHGSYAAALRAWKYYAHPDDNAAEGIPGLFIVWEFTAAARELKGGAPGREQRLADQLQFMAETMFDWNREAARFLREDLGARQLVNAGNWKSVDELTEDAERWSYTANEVIGKNHYFGGQHKGLNVGWQILPHQYFSNPSGTLEPESLPFNVKQVVGHPFVIPESLWVPPMLYQSEGPLMVAAQCSLTGVDSFFWFANGAPEWQAPLNKWTYATPMLLGQFPAAALMYRKSYVKPAAPVVVEQRPLQGLWDRKTPLIAEGRAYDPNRDRGDKPENASFQGVVDPLAFMVGPVHVKYGGDPARTRVADLAPFIDRNRKIVRSATGELATDFGKGLYTVNAPKVQAAAGFLRQAGPVQLADVRIACANPYAAIVVIALDDRPLADSKKVLIQAGTTCRPAGWAARPARFKAADTMVSGFRILDTGGSRWEIEKADAQVRLKNPALERARALDANLMPIRKLEATTDGGSLSVRLPEDAFYVLVD
ncbi:MAG TPA: hypothetical protein P5555_09670 [Candidatus Paceibacterota bacterium]|nr:hypothetical protein [Verrucomicrobiota bacterium]HOX02493.1 hypothetical protein [Verrucomicrobiota bacterium]HRZ45444.1 hypothetical protein [Candidatus Paceibacterota bacterium]HRZ92239.1 hypothetical protein [Candidatus Paceibacterota bacterium]